MKPDERLAAARGLAAGRIAHLTGLATRTVYAEPADSGGDVLVTLLVIVPGPEIDAALADTTDTFRKEESRG